MFERLIRLALGRSRAVLIGAFVFFLLGGAYGGGLAAKLAPSDPFVAPASPSAKANELFENVAGFRAAPGVLLLLKTKDGVRTQEGMRLVRKISRRAGRDKAVRRVADVRDGDEAYEKAKKKGREDEVGSFVSKDGKMTYVAVFVAPGEDENAVADRLAQSFAPEIASGQVMIGGAGPAGFAIAEQVVTDLAAAEQIAFPILFVMMLFVFRGLVAALLPMFVGILTIFGTLSLLRLVNEAIPLSVYALNLTVGLGLGLAIDYSLFVVSRYREELSKGLTPRVAISQTIHTAGRTVFFSSLTVAAALVSLGVFPQQFLYSMAIAGCITALMASSISLIALPALLLALGHKVNALAPKRWQHAEQKDGSGVWYHLSHWVMKHALLVTLVTSTSLLIVGSPFLRINFTGLDARVVPDGLPSKTIDTALRTDFASAASEPISVVLSPLPATETKAVDAYVARIKKLPNIKSIGEPLSIPPAQTWQFDVNPIAASLDPQTLKLIEELRSIKAPGPSYVGGQTARFVDQQAALGHGLPIAMVIIGFATMTILFLMTGSVLLPIKSLIMNILAISAAFGIMVWIFQDGRFEGVLGYTSQGGIEATMPLLLLALAFGLSTDYGVFLLTRIKEGRDHGLSNEEAVAIGIQRTGKIITAAGLLFCIAIGAFATSKIIFIKQVGVGTTAAVMLDAVVVRALLVPALMKLLGDWNWWSPAPLRKLHDRLGIDESAPELLEEHVPKPAAPPKARVAPPAPRPL
ncbi:MAG: MMPL family transporter [Solirubrobacteraceae bacterium]|nr:MMPL family transporter [Solirubrobacteraceae bacterium]